MNVDLQLYSTKSVLQAYEFLFSQYMAGELSPDPLQADIPTSNIFGEMTRHVRDIYLSRSDADIDELVANEKKTITDLATYLTVSDEKLLSVLNDFISEIEVQIKAKEEASKDDLLIEVNGSRIPIQKEIFDLLLATSKERDYYRDSSKGVVDRFSLN